MTETQSGYATYRPQLQTSIDGFEQPRISHEERDELIRQVDGMCDGQQELIERLAQMVIEERRAWQEAWGRGTTLAIERDEARQLVREVESMLSQCDGDGCAAWELLRDARAWAKAWKAKAKFDRTAWLNSLLPGIAKAWHKRKWRYRRPVAAHLTRVVYEDDMIHHCGQCGALLQIVRPGKWQCPGCE